jgi:hypothetical protein
MQRYLVYIIRRNILSEGRLNGGYGAQREAQNRGGIIDY